MGLGPDRLDLPAKELRGRIEGRHADRHQRRPLLVRRCCCAAAGEQGQPPDPLLGGASACQRGAQPDLDLARGVHLGQLEQAPEAAAVGVAGPILQLGELLHEVGARHPVGEQWPGLAVEQELELADLLAGVKAPPVDGERVPAADLDLARELRFDPQMKLGVG